MKASDIKYQTLKEEVIAYRIREGGTIPVLMLHGNMSSSIHWDLLMEKLPPKYTLYAPDIRGFGHSSYNHSFNSLSELADDIIEFTL